MPSSSIDHPLACCYSMLLLTLTLITATFYAELVSSQDFFPFSNSSSLLSDKGSSRFFLNSPPVDDANKFLSKSNNVSAANLRHRSALTESVLLSPNEPTDFPLQRELRQFNYDTNNPWSSSVSANNNAGGSGNLLNSNNRRNDFVSNSRVGSSSMPGDVRRAEQPRRNSNSRSNSPPSPGSSPWDTDSASRNGMSSAADQWPSAPAATAADRMQSPSASGSSLFSRNYNPQQYSSQVRPSASSYSPQNSSPWNTENADRAGGNSRSAAAATGTTEDDEDDEWDNVEGSGDTTHDQTDPFSTADGRPASPSSSGGFNLVGQPPSKQPKDNWQLPPNTRASSESGSRQPVAAGGSDIDGSAKNYAPNFGSGSGGSRQSSSNRDESRASQQFPGAGSYDEATGYAEDELEESHVDNHPSWGQSPYDELPSTSTSSTTALPPVALPPAVGPGASGGGVSSSTAAATDFDEGDVGEDEDSTIKPVRIPTNTVYREEKIPTKNEGESVAKGRPSPPTRPNNNNNTTNDLIMHTGRGNSTTETTAAPPSWSWFSALAIQFFDSFWHSFWQKMTEEPGLLAAVIGGAVIGLLCAILLAMFLIYRMRKKDEGSYALDESTVYRKPGGYMRAPTSEITAKEYYA